MFSIFHVPVDVELHEILVFLPIITHNLDIKPLSCT